MKARNKYKRKRHLHGTYAPAKTVFQKVKYSTVATGKDLIMGVIGGAIGSIAGRLIGKPAIFIGAGVTGYGHYANKPILTTLGVSMMAVSGAKFLAEKGIGSTEGDDLKTRWANLKDDLSSSLFSTSGVGEIQYLTYPNATKELNFSALDNLQNQIAQSGADYQKSIRGTNEDDIMQGSDDENVQGVIDDSLDLSNTSY